MAKSHNPTRATRESEPGTYPTDDPRYLCNADERDYNFYGGSVVQGTTKTRRNLEKADNKKRERTGQGIRRLVRIGN